jgi:hypothetical protein
VSWPQRDEPVQILTSPDLDFDTRSLGMICSAGFFFPLGMEYPPLVVT